MYDYADGVELWNRWQNGYLDTAPEWFTKRDKITRIVIDQGVENVGNQVFKGLKNVKSVIMPKSVTSIGDSAFGYCGK